MTTDTTGLRQSRVLLKQASLRRSSADTWVARHTLRDSQVLPRSGGSSCDFKVYFNFPKTQCWLLSVTSACLHVRVFCFRNFSLTPEFLHLKCTGNHQSWLTLRPQGLWPAGLLCPWGSPGKNPGVDGHFLLQGNFPTQGLNLGPLHCKQILYHLEAPYL